MREKKSEIVKALLPVLQMTKEFSNLTALEYEDLDLGESVFATFKDDYETYTVEIEVTLARGEAAIIQTIMDELLKQLWFRLLWRSLWISDWLMPLAILKNF